jgi:hypothetical protein
MFLTSGSDNGAVPPYLCNPDNRSLPVPTPRSSLRIKPPASCMNDTTLPIAWLQALQSQEHVLPYHPQDIPELTAYIPTCMHLLCYIEFSFLPILPNWIYLAVPLFRIHMYAQIFTAPFLDRKGGRLTISAHGLETRKGVIVNRPSEPAIELLDENVRKPSEKGISHWPHLNLGSLGQRGYRVNFPKPQSLGVSIQ